MIANEFIISKKARIYLARTMMTVLCLLYLYVTWVSPVDNHKKELPLAKGTTAASVVTNRIGADSAGEENQVAEAQMRKVQIEACKAVKAGKLVPGYLSENHEHEKDVRDEPKRKSHRVKVATKRISETKPSEAPGQKITFVGLADSERERIACAAITLHFEGPVEDAIKRLGGVRADHAQGIDTSRFLVNVRGSSRFFGVTLKSDDGQPVKLMLPSDRQRAIWDAIARKTHKKIKMDKTSLVTRADVWFNALGEIASVDVEVI